MFRNGPNEPHGTLCVLVYIDLICHQTKFSQTSKKCEDNLLQSIQSLPGQLPVEEQCKYYGTKGKKIRIENAKLFENLCEVIMIFLFMIYRVIKGHFVILRVQLKFLFSRACPTSFNNK